MTLNLAELRRLEATDKLEELTADDEPCPGCGDGDKVPASGYWRCPVCDAEWSGEDAE